MKIMVLTNTGGGLYSFRKELLETLFEDGHTIYVSFPEDEYASKLIEMGCKYIKTDLERRGMNPLKDLKLLRQYRRMIRTIQPDLVLTYTIKPNVYGGLLCRRAKIPYIVNITGLGTTMENKGLLRSFVLFLYRLGLKEASTVFFQNEKNHELFSGKGIVGNNARRLPGSGVNTKHYGLLEYPKDADVVRLLYSGRLMREKGTDEFLKAAEHFHKTDSSIEFHMIGVLEEDYEEPLKQLGNIGAVYFHGEQRDVRPMIKEAHAIVVPSYHEGMSNVLLEAASCGRPVLASDIPGCRETFTENVTGMSFQPKDVESLKRAINKFTALPYPARREMGLRGREKMVREYDRKIVIEAYQKAIQSSLQELNEEGSYELI